MDFFAFKALIGGGGSEVVANQSGSPTRTLQTLSVNGVGYKIVGIAYTEESYSSVVSVLNAAAKGSYALGASIYVKTRNIPDLWIYRNNEETQVSYTYVSDAQFISDMAAASGALSIGYFKVCALEGEKVDLTNYVQKTDIASELAAGLIKSANDNGFIIDAQGNPSADSKTFVQYTNANVTLFVSKGTLENVLTNEALRIDGTAQNISDAMKTDTIHKLGLSTEDTVTSAQWATYTGNAEIVDVLD